MEAAIRARQRRGEYDAITSGRQFAQLLTDHLREVSHDWHLSVDAMPQGPPPPPPPPSAVPQTLEERQRAQAARQNFEFVRVERLAGNIGYVELRGFMPPAVAGETAAAAMTFVASADAVIFDLRQNGGGDPAMVAFLTSYLFGPRPVRLNDFYSRTTNQTRQSWTLPVRSRPATHRHGRLHPHQRAHVFRRRGVHLQPETSQAGNCRRRDHGRRSAHRVRTPHQRPVHDRGSEWAADQCGDRHELGRGWRRTRREGASRPRTQGGALAGARETAAAPHVRDAGFTERGDDGDRGDAK